MEGREEGFKEVRKRNAEVEAEKYEEGKLKGVEKGLQAGEYNKQ